MSFAKNQSQWSGHEQHKNYYRMEYFTVKNKQRYYAQVDYEENGDEKQIIELPSAIGTLPDDHASYTKDKEAIKYIDLTRHHLLAQQLLRNRQEYDEYLGELDELIELERQRNNNLNYYDIIPCQLKPFM